jgi:tetratricopeptide (TPR) repeat protein
VLEADPNNVTALNNLAYRLANDTDQFDEALKYAQQVKDLDPNDPTVEDTIGWALYRKGLYRNALEHLQRAVSKQPTAIEKYHLSMALVRAGDKEHGLSMLQQARKMDPTLPESAAAQAVITGQSN